LKDLSVKRIEKQVGELRSAAGPVRTAAWTSRCVVNANIIWFSASSGDHLASAWRLCAKCMELCTTSRRRALRLSPVAGSQLRQRNSPWTSPSILSMEQPC